MSKNKGKLVSISKELHSKLQTMGHKGQSFNDLIQILYDFWDKHDFKSKSEQMKSLREQNPIVDFNE